MAYDTNNIFAKILRGEIPSKKVYEDEHTLAFHDINPLSPTHILVIPKEHIASLEALGDQHGGLLASLVAAANEVAREDGVAGGFRVVTNIGRAAGQSVDHLHLHVLGGRSMSWPPG